MVGNYDTKLQFECGMHRGRCKNVKSKRKQFGEKIRRRSKEMLRLDNIKSGTIFFLFFFLSTKDCCGTRLKMVSSIVASRITGAFSKRLLRYNHSLIWIKLLYNVIHSIYSQLFRYPNYTPLKIRCSQAHLSVSHWWNSASLFV